MIQFAAYRETHNGVIVRIDEKALHRYTTVKILQLCPVNNSFLVYDPLDESRFFLGHWDSKKEEFISHPQGSFIGRIFQRIWTEAIRRSPDLLKKMETI